MAEENFRRQLQLLKRPCHRRSVQDLKSLVASFAKLKFFQDLDPTLSRQVCRYLQLDHFVGGVTIFAEGEPGDKFYIILSGSVAVCVKDLGVDEIGPAETRQSALGTLAGQGVQALQQANAPPAPPPPPAPAGAPAPAEAAPAALPTPPKPASPAPAPAVGGEAEAGLQKKGRLLRDARPMGGAGSTSAPAAEDTERHLRRCLAELSAGHEADANDWLRAARSPAPSVLRAGDLDAMTRTPSFFGAGDAMNPSSNNKGPKISRQMTLPKMELGPPPAAGEPYESECSQASSRRESCPGVQGSNTELAKVARQSALGFKQRASHLEGRAPGLRLSLMRMTMKSGKSLCIGATMNEEAEEEDEEEEEEDQSDEDKTESDGQSGRSSGRDDEVEEVAGFALTAARASSTVIKVGDVLGGAATGEYTPRWEDGIFRMDSKYLETGHEQDGLDRTSSEKSIQTGSKATTKNQEESSPRNAAEQRRQTTQRRLTQERRTVELVVLKAGDTFGEVALQCDQPRSATVKTLEPSYLATLSRDDFMSILCATVEQQRQERTAFIRDLPLFEGFGESAVHKLTALMQRRMLARNEFVYDLGAPVVHVFFARQGEFAVSCRLVDMEGGAEEASACAAQRGRPREPDRHNDKFIVVALLTPPSVFGLSCYLRGEKRYSNRAVCLSASGSVYTLVAKELVSCFTMERRSQVQAVSRAQDVFYENRMTVLSRLASTRESRPKAGAENNAKRFWPREPTLQERLESARVDPAGPSAVYSLQGRLQTISSCFRDTALSDLMLKPCWKIQELGGAIFDPHAAAARLEAVEKRTQDSQLQAALKSHVLHLPEDRPEAERVPPPRAPPEFRRPGTNSGPARLTSTSVARSLSRSAETAAAQAAAEIGEPVSARRLPCRAAASPSPRKLSPLAGKREVNAEEEARGEAAAGGARLAAPTPRPPALLLPPVPDGGGPAQDAVRTTPSHAAPSTSRRRPHRLSTCTLSGEAAPQPAASGRGAPSGGEQEQPEAEGRSPAGGGEGHLGGGLFSERLVAAVTAPQVLEGSSGPGSPSSARSSSGLRSAEDAARRPHGPSVQHDLLYRSRRWAPAPRAPPALPPAPPLEAAAPARIALHAV